jgi:hypothetical protein
MDKVYHFSYRGIHGPVLCGASREYCYWSLWKMVTCEECSLLILQYLSTGEAYIENSTSREQILWNEK